MKKSNDTIGNRIRDLPACSAVPQPTALPRVPSQHEYGLYLKTYRLFATTVLQLKICDFLGEAFKGVFEVL
jgi:hypothetical protein